MNFPLFKVFFIITPNDTNIPTMFRGNKTKKLILLLNKEYGLISFSISIKTNAEKFNKKIIKDKIAKFLIFIFSILLYYNYNHLYTMIYLRLYLGLADIYIYYSSLHPF